jgi:hypothetical protein
MLPQMPALPFRRRRAAAAAPPQPPQQQQAPQQAPQQRQSGVRLTELDADGQPLPCNGVDGAAPQQQWGRDAAGTALVAAPAWRGMDAARMQGALAVALCVHAFALMPAAAARVGFFAA